MSIISELLEGGTRQMQKKKKNTLRAICITLALLALTLTVALGIGIVSLISDAVEQGKTPTDKPISIKDTETVVLDPQQMYSGELLLLDSTHPFRGEASVILIKSKERPQTSAGTNAYTIGAMDKFCGTEEAIKALNNMIKAFYSATKDDNIYIANAYNTEAEQDALFLSGTAFELDYFSAAEEEDWSQKSSIYGVSTYNWIYNNAHKYGFVVANGYGDGEGSNVFRYVGIPNATAAKAQKLSFEAYLESLKTATPDSPVNVKSGNMRYAIYYLSAEGEHKVPADYDYSVSGNNSDGYIITVKVPNKS